MLYFKIVNKKVVAIDNVIRSGSHWFNCTHFHSNEFAIQIAESATKFANRVYIAVDYDLSALAKYDVIKLPIIGDRICNKVNNNYVCDGMIIDISTNWNVITTASGSKYYRKNFTGIWIKDNGEIMFNCSK